MAKPNGIVVYNGPSMLNPSVQIVSIITFKTTNAKTGAMHQQWILADDGLNPVEAVAQRMDGAICGGCPHKRQPDGTRSCYVNTGQAPQAVYRTFKKGGYPVWDGVSPIPQIVDPIRFGAYGDPAGLPEEVQRKLVAMSPPGYTGYTHQWKSKKFRWALDVFQASIDNIEELEHPALANAGTFRVMPVGGSLLPGEIYCPADKEKDVTCSNCGMCNGSGNRIAIEAHGSGKNYVQLKRRATG
jgi:hypothetical protein